MAALLTSLDTDVDVLGKDDALLSVARSHGARVSYLHSRASNIVSNAIIKIKSFNALSNVDPMTATTWFGAAFALACSNETQCDKENGMSDKEHECITKLRTKYGLMSDLWKEGGVPDEMTHRFNVTSAAVELGFAGFGITPWQDGWSGFEQKIADTITMHGFGAGCAGAFKILLPDTVRSARAPDADPLVPIKDYLRKHAYTAKKVTRVKLKEQVTTYYKATKALEKHAELVCDTTTKEPCVVVALNGDKAPFADVLVGVLTVEGGSFRTTHLMLVQLKYCISTELSVLEEWVEMRRMGSGEREAVIAGCVAQLTRAAWGDAMKPLTSTEKHRATFDAARADLLFAKLCGDDNVAVRHLSPYEKALESYARSGPQTFAATLANYLNARKVDEPDEPLQRDENVLQSARKVPNDLLKFLSLKKKRAVVRALLVKLNANLAASTERAAKYDNLIAGCRNVVRSNSSGGSLLGMVRSLEVEKFIVKYYPSNAANDESTTGNEAEEAPPTVTTVKSPVNSLTITKDNRAAAFYPTGWEADTFVTSTITREVIQPILRPKPKRDSPALNAAGSSQS